MNNKFPMFQLDHEIPTPKAILARTPEAEVFVNHITKNTQGANWKCIKYLLNETNYQSFILAFSLVALDLTPSETISIRFQANARFLKKNLEKKGIMLSGTEEELLNLLVNFFNWKKRKANRNEYLNYILLKLYSQYDC